MKDISIILPDWHNLIIYENMCPEQVIAIMNAIIRAENVQKEYISRKVQCSNSVEELFID